MDPILRPQQPTISPCVHRIPVHEPFDLGRSRYSRYKPIPIQRFTTSGVLSSPGEQHSQPCRQPLKFSKQKWAVLDAINKGVPSGAFFFKRNSLCFTSHGENRWLSRRHNQTTISFQFPLGCNSPCTTPFISLTYYDKRHRSSCHYCQCWSDHHRVM